MPSEPTNVAGLVDEYCTLADELPAGVLSGTEAIRRKLVTDADWSPDAADELVHLATQYGAFMLRNALALALALEIEDGALGY